MPDLYLTLVAGGSTSTPYTMAIPSTYVPDEAQCKSATYSATLSDGSPLPLPLFGLSGDHTGLSVTFTMAAGAAEETIASKLTWSYGTHQLFSGTTNVHLRNCQIIGGTTDMFSPSGNTQEYLKTVSNGATPTSQNFALNQVDPRDPANNACELSFHLTALDSTSSPSALFTAS